ncbi:MAG: DHH family phosphoesterase, partial [Clostridia bacterium]|nr:DHH family phosphoesterase [Clostridia bacterium]
MLKRKEWLKMTIAILAGVLAIGLFVLLVELTAIPPLLVGIVLAVLYGLGIFLWFFISGKRRLKEKEDSNVPALNHILYEMVKRMDRMILLCDEISERIFWHNHRVRDLVGENYDLKRTTVGAIFGKTASQLVDTPIESQTPIRIGDRYFLSTGNRIPSSERTFCLISFLEITEEERLKRQMSDRDLVVGYILIDNADELLQYEQERYRSVVSRVDTILRDWASDADGILKEYEKDRYLFLLSRESFLRFRESQFEILDKIRDIHTGESGQPVTLSIGFSDVSGSYTDKEKNAQQALETALQRGGDQIVVRSDGETEIFGGRTKSVQKRTRVRSRVIAAELISLISKASDVIIMGHKYADYDAIASAVGLARICKFCGTEVHIVINRADPNIQGCLRIIEREEEYASVFIDASRGLDRIRTGTLVLVTDVSNPSQFEAPEIVRSATKYVVIDHHRKAVDFEKEPVISYIEPSASAASELVAEMLEQIMPDEGLLPSEANLLLAGILLDTKQFTKNTGSRTFSAALYLRDHGADVASVQDLFSTSLDELRREARFQSNVVIYRDVTAIAYCEGPADGGDRLAAAKTADRLLTVSGVEASFTMIPLEGSVHISARSKGKINVQLILEK